MAFHRISLAVSILLYSIATARAQSAPGSDPLPYTSVAATSAASASPICTDRPTKSNFACTVPAGDFQIESDLFNWSRATAPGGSTDTYLVTNPTLKYGIGSTTDIEVNIAPYEDVRAHVAGLATSVAGTGDLYLRVKQSLTGSGGHAQLSVIPYIKVPTAPTGIGNRQWEGGVIAPFNYSLSHSITLTIVPEVDILADTLTPSRRHTQLVGLVNLGFGLTSKLTLYTELWTAQNFDPPGTVRQSSADTALAYQVTPTLQFDVGGNFGLNCSTPDVQLYVGISTRF